MSFLQVQAAWGCGWAGEGNQNYGGGVAVFAGDYLIDQAWAHNVTMTLANVAVTHNTAGERRAVSTGSGTGGEWGVVMVDRARRLQRAVASRVVAVWEARLSCT